MIGFDEASLMAFFAQYAYQPWAVYGFIIGFMFASSFGLPVPEELTLISAGLVAYMAKNPDLFPPPYPGAVSVNTFTLSFVCFLAVFMSDLTVYFIGKFFGARIIKTKFFKKRVAGEGYDRINSWFQKYGGWACGIFRFTPGLRFPGHMSCGLLGISVWKFIAVDGLAALISVPTQVYFVSTYGEMIIANIRKFKLYVFGAMAILLIVWLIRRIYQKNVRRNDLQLR
jgi:membrane protein DedA with SNARE-associated domain